MCGQVIQLDNSLSKAISKVKWAYFLIYVHLKIANIDLLADWWAYIIILGVIPVIAEYEPSAMLLKPMATLLVFTEIAGQIAEFTGMGFPYTINVIICIMYTYLHFQLITNIHTAVTDRGCSGGWLLWLRNITVVSHTVYFLFLNLSSNTLMVWLFGIVDLIGCISLIFSLSGQAAEVKQTE